MCVMYVYFFFKHSLFGCIQKSPFEKHLILISTHLKNINDFVCIRLCDKRNHIKILWRDKKTKQQRPRKGQSAQKSNNKHRERIIKFRMVIIAENKTIILVKKNVHIFFIHRHSSEYKGVN